MNELEIIAAEQWINYLAIEEYDNETPNDWPLRQGGKSYLD